LAATAKESCDSQNGLYNQMESQKLLKCVTSPKLLVSPLPKLRSIDSPCLGVRRRSE